MKNMITHAAKLVWNENQWKTCTGLASDGMNVTTPEGSYNYGLEEWLFHDVPKDHKIGYIDCYRRRTYSDIANIALFTFHENEALHIGNIWGVRAIENNAASIAHYQNLLNQQNWIEEVISPNFDEIEICPPGASYGLQVYIQKNFNATQVQGRAGTGFVVNITYDCVEFINTPISLTAIDDNINESWRHLSIRYIIDNLKSPRLIEYFKGYNKPC